MSHIINSDFHLYKKTKIFKVFNGKFINEKRIDSYGFFNIPKVSIKNFTGIFTKDSYDKMID